MEQLVREQWNFIGIVSKHTVCLDQKTMVIFVAAAGIGRHSSQLNRGNHEKVKAQWRNVFALNISGVCVCMSVDKIHRNKKKAPTYGIFHLKSTALTMLFGTNKTGNSQCLRASVRMCIRAPLYVWVLQWNISHTTCWVMSSILYSVFAVFLVLVLLYGSYCCCMLLPLLFIMFVNVNVYCLCMRFSVYTIYGRSPLDICVRVVGSACLRCLAKKKRCFD